MIYVSDQIQKTLTRYLVSYTIYYCTWHDINLLYIVVSLRSAHCRTALLFARPACLPCCSRAAIHRNFAPFRAPLGVSLRIISILVELSKRPAEPFLNLSHLVRFFCSIRCSIYHLPFPNSLGGLYFAALHLYPHRTTRSNPCPFVSHTYFVVTQVSCVL